MLEIARQSVPDGYGNSYFWVKPDRIVPADLVKTVGGRLDHTGAELRPFDEDGAAAVARWFRDRGVDTLGVCFLHSYANPDHERRMAAVLASEHPAAVVSLSCEVLREYREYERSMTTLLDAAVKPRVASYLARDQRPARRAGRAAAAAARDEVQRRRALRRGGDQAADHDRAERTGGRRARRRPDREASGRHQGADLRRRRHVHRRGRRHRRRAGADHRGQGRGLPVDDPDGRRGHGRGGRRLDRLGLAGRGAEGRAALGGGRPRADVLRAGRRATSPSPTRTSRSAGSRRTCSAARFRSTPTPHAPGWPRWPARWASASRTAPPASSRCPPSTRPTPSARSPSSAASTSATSRSSRSAGPARCCSAR